MSNTTGVLLEAGTAYPLQAPDFFFGGVRVAHLFSFLCCPIMCLYVLVCRSAHVLFMLFVFVCAL